MATSSHCIPEHQHDAVDFSSNMPQAGSPDTPNLRPAEPQFTLIRKFFNDRFRFPDGLETEIWTFEDGSGRHLFPAPPIRAREDHFSHVTLEPSKRVHTIHHHGIEPEPVNDGVGHTSFEVTGSYTYQWRPERGTPGDPNTGAAGTYFYHCHVNTTLHVQMGMFGSLIVDPADAGRGRAFVDGPFYEPTSESIWVTYAVQPDWHELSHAAGLQGEDVGLNRFRPTNFYVLGGVIDQQPATGVWSAPVTVRRAGSETTLIRLNNATYHPVVFDFGDLGARAISHDGRPFRNTSAGKGHPAPPVECPVRRLRIGAAERFEVVVRQNTKRTYPVTVTFEDWITRAVIGRTTAEVRVV